MNYGAKRLGLDKFKMISQDKDSTVFQHPAGHSITVAHNSLSKDLKTQLLGLSKAGQDEKTRLQASEEKSQKRKMADGGEVSDQEGYEKDRKEQYDREMQRRSMKASDATGAAVSPTMEKGLQKKYPTAQPVQQYAAGEMVEGDNQAPIIPQDASQPVINFAEPSSITTDVPAEYQTSEDKQAAANEAEMKDYTSGANSTAGLAAKANEPAEAQSQVSAPEQAQEAKPARQPAEAPSEAVKEAAPAQVHETPEQKATNTYHAEKNDIQQDMQKFNQDLLAGHIEPKTFNDLMANKSTFGKIGTIFGMLVSGLGSGASGQKNAVLEMMNQQIQNDLDAQKTSASNAQNLYKINKEAIEQQARANNLNIDTRTKAEVLTKMQMQSKALHDMAKLADSLPPGPKKDAAMQNLAMASQAVNTQFANLSDLAAGQSARLNLMMGIGGGGQGEDATAQRISYLRASGNEPMAKALEERYVPGVGTAKIPVPQAVREDIISHDKLTNAAQDVLNFSKQHTNIVPGTPSYNTGIQKATVLQQMVREGLLGTVFRESEKPLLQQIVDENPAGVFKMLSTQPKLKSLIESNIQQLNATKKAYGLPTTQHQQEPQYKTVNGVKYMRGPNGEAIPVK